MPRQQIIKKDNILNAAYEFVLEQGINNLSFRRLAAKLGCSTQPICSCFNNIDNLKIKTHIFVNQIYIRKMFQIFEMPNFIEEITKWLIEVAKSSRNIFGVLFYYDGIDEENLFDVMRNLAEDNYIIDKIKTSLKLNEQAAQFVYIRCCNLWASIDLHTRRKSDFIEKMGLFDFIKSMIDETIESASNKYK